MEGRAPKPLRGRTRALPYSLHRDHIPVYDFISGTVADRTGTSVIIDAAGVGFELLAPLGAPFPTPGSQAKVYSHLVVREDAQTLFGFPQRQDRDLFRILLRVRGVGPSMALGVMSGLSPQDMVNAVAHENLKAFTAVKGVGKKTGEQILLDLRDKLGALMAVTGGGASPLDATPTEEQTQPANVLDAVTALVSIGYSEKEAAKKVEAALKDVGSDDLEALVRAAMRS